MHAHVTLAAALACGIVAFSSTPLGICLRVLASLLTATQVAGSGSFLRSQTHGHGSARRGAVDGPAAVERRIPILDDLRVCVTMSTVIAILAVDFPLFFPRRFCKTEEYGISLMDAGVGAFVFLSGLSSRLARSGTPWDRAGRAAAFPVTPLVCALLGLGRLVAVRTLGYQEHVTEYGTEWNFFLTLACLQALDSAVTRARLSPRTVVGAALAALSVYQIMLARGGLAEWILHAPRAGGSLARNREGVLTLTGYVVVFAAGAAVGQRSLWMAPSVAADRCSALAALGRQRVGRAAASWLLYALALLVLGADPSRRLGNASYVLLSYAYGETLLGTVALLRAAVKANAPEASAVPDLPALEALGPRQLPFFLIANLLTGAVNMGMDTVSAEPATAFFVLLAYVGASVAVAVMVPGPSSWRRG